MCLRGDIEIAVIESEPRLQIPTTRFLLTGEFLYHFPFFKTSISHFYAGLGLGIAQVLPKLVTQLVLAMRLVFP